MKDTLSFQNFIQVAGIIDEEEARLLIDCGVSFLGFPLRLPVHTDDLTEDAAAEIIQSFRPPIHGVLITYLEDGNEIAIFADTLQASAVQLHGHIELDELKRLRLLKPDISIIKSLVTGLIAPHELVRTVESTSDYVDAFITDTYDPETGASGATGKTHDWSISRHIVEASSRPVILAGGLTPGNVKGAILEVTPAGVDVHTGVEDASGRKDPALIEAFLAEANAGFSEISPAANRNP